MTAHCSDAGEPSGTAGRPALAVLQGSGLGDVAVVVTRYFGGTKLGTGGLVRAYSEAVRAVLAVLPRAKRRRPNGDGGGRITLCSTLATADGAHHGEILDEDFAADVTVSARFRVERFPAFQAALLEMTAGTIRAEILSPIPTPLCPWMDRG